MLVERILRGVRAVNYLKAADAHLAWVGELWDDLMHRAPLDAPAVGRDDLCDLGKWLHGEGQRYRDLDGFQALEALHRDFHRCAAHSVELAQAGKLQEALGRLDAGGDCEMLSGRLLGVCVEFFDTLSRGKASRRR